MSKAISPLIAAVLLIGFTMAIAAILAAWATQWTTTRVGGFETKPEIICAGGGVSFISGYPKWDAGQIKAVIEVKEIPLGNFSFVAILTNDTTMYYRDILSSSAKPGVPVTIISEQTGLSKAEISRLEVVTNCSGVTTLWSTIY